MRMLVIRNKGQIWKKSPDGPIIFYIKKKKKKKITILHAYCVQNFGPHIPYTLKIMLSKHIY